MSLSIQYEEKKNADFCEKWDGCESSTELDGRKLRIEMNWELMTE